MFNLEFFLSQYKSLLIEIEEKEKRLNEIRSWTKGASSRITGLKKDLNQENKSCKDITGSINLEKSLNKSLNKCMSILAKIEDIIRQIPDSRDRIILFSRYIRGETWSQIANRLGFSCESVPRKRFSRMKEKLNLG